MYLCYSDESGFNGKAYNPSQPVQVMASVFPNAYNFHRSDTEFKEVFKIINTKIPIAEIKADQIYRGKGAWEHVPANVRDKVIEFYITWVTDRKHKLIVSAIDNKTFFELRQAQPPLEFATAIPYPYLLAGLQVALVLQRLNRTQPKNKGKSLLIFDEQDQFADALSDLVFNPPAFIDEFVPYEPKRETCRLCQVVDTAFFVKSHQSSMAQVVDIVAYLFRLHLELAHYGMEEAYAGEAAKVAAWVALLQTKFVPFSTVFPKPKTPFLAFLNSVKAKGV